MSIFCIHQFEIQPRKQQTSWQCWEAVRDVLAGWIPGSCWAAGVRGLQLAFDGSRLAPLPGQEVRTYQQIGQTHRLATLEWTVPDDLMAEAVFQTSIHLAADARGVELAFIIHHVLPTFGLRFDRTKYRIAETNPLTKYSEWLAKLICDWDCRIGGWRIPTREQIVTAKQVDAFVRNTLANPARTLPLVVIAGESLECNVKVQPTALPSYHRNLLCLAGVVLLSDKEADAHLMQRVGAERSLLGAAFRLYWPGFSREAPPADHPMRTIQQLRQLGSGDAVINDLCQYLRNLAVTSFQEGRILRAAREALQSEQNHSARIVAEGAAQLAAVQTHLRQSQQDHQRLQQANDESQRRVQALQSELANAKPRREEVSAELSAELEQAWDEMDRLAAEGEAARQRIADLEADLSALRKNWALLWKGPPPKLEAESPPPREEQTFASAIDALRAAKEAFADVFLVWDDAWQSATESTFSSPEKVFQALRAIAEVGRAYFAAQQGGPPLGPVEQAFACRVPFKYTGFESQTTLSFYGRDRVFHHGDDSRLMQRHLTLGGGTTNNCLQIYFDFDDALRRVLIGYCGRHLRYYRQRT